MDFSLDWFLSIPGLLISGGVLLFIIALILLIATMAKKKKKTGDTPVTANNEAPAQNAAMPQAAMPQAGVNNNSALPEMNSPSVTGGTIMDIPAPTVPPVAGQMPDMNANVNMSMNNAMPTGTQPNMAMPTMDMAGAQMPPMQQPIDMAGAQMPPMQQPIDMAQPMNTTPQMPTQEVVTPSALTNETVVEAPQAPVVEPMAQPITPQATPEVAPIAPMENQVPAMPSVEPIAPAVTPEPIAPQPVAQEPIAPIETTQAPVMPTVEPAPQNAAMNATIQPTPIETVPQTETTMKPQQGPVIYGGASPIVPDININEQQHQIYGGANPLENTQSIPISNLTGQQNVVQTPSSEPTMVTQQAVPVVEQPTNVGQ